MLRRLMWMFISTAMLAASAPLLALSNYQVGGCKPPLTNFTTIQAAVSSVPAGATILVCPGVYPEQVTITQPLTLQGVASGNASRAVITINPNGVPGPNVTSILPQGLYAQVLVQNVNPPGPVNLIGITVDGTGGNIGCSTATGLVGIFYASGTAGTINEVTTRNQQSSGCGNGIWAENGPGANQTVIIENSSVRNFDGFGITAFSNQTSSTLTATIKGNFMNTPSPAEEINAENIAGTITGNFTTGGGMGISSLSESTGITVSGNTVADVLGGTGLQVASGTTATTNKVANVNNAFFFPNSGATVKSNTIMNANSAFVALCDSPVSANIVNDSQIAFQTPFHTPMGNALYNVDTIQTGSCL